MSLDPTAIPEPIRRLIKPRLALYSEERPGSVLAGVWKGEGVVSLPAGLPVPSGSVPEHWLSVDCGWLERNGFGIRGCLSIYGLSASDFLAVNDPAAELVVRGGEPLFGVQEESLPDTDALEAYLSQAEFDELRDVWEGGLAQQAQANCPIYRSDLVAVLGGWHISWPEGPPKLPLLAAIIERCRLAGGPGCVPPAETYPIEPYRLAVWTLRDAEPWVEVLVGPDGSLHTFSHVT